MKNAGRLKVPMMKIHILWKVYFWFLTVVVLALLGGSIMQGVTAIKIVDIPISLVALAGVFGFAYQKSVLTGVFWKAWLPVVILWDIFANFVWDGRAQMEGLGLLDIIVVVAFFYLLFLPGYIALYQYGFRSERIWNRVA